mmetsp:Transcript_36345/g.96005  ORF Transcript_36345/g.96005 Transcript_36345/m.96005 type:complete len:237 (-) Transcript_36345:2443-3153(-)
MVGSSKAVSALSATSSASSLMSHSESASRKPCASRPAGRPSASGSGTSTREACSIRSSWLPPVATAPSASLFAELARPPPSRLLSRSAAPTVVERVTIAFSKSAAGTLQRSRRCAGLRAFQKSCSRWRSMAPLSSARPRRPPCLRPLVSRSELESPPSCRQRCMRASRSRRLVTLDPSSMSSLLTMCRFSSSAACSMALSASIISASTLTNSIQPSAFCWSSRQPSSAACVTCAAG